MERLEFDDILPLEKRLQLVNCSETLSNPSKKPLIERPKQTQLFERLDVFLPAIRAANEQTLRELKQKSVEKEIL